YLRRISLSSLRRPLPASVTDTGSSTAHQKWRVLMVKRVRDHCRIGSSSSGSLWRRCSSSQRSASTSSLLCSSTYERSAPYDSNRMSESEAYSGQRRCGTTRFVVLWWVAHIRIYWARSLLFDLGTIAFHSAGVGGGRPFHCCDQLSLLSSDGKKGERWTCRVAAGNVHQHSHRACGHGCYTSTQRRPEKLLVDTGGQVDLGVVDDLPWIFVRSGTRRTDSGRAGWPCGAPGGAAGERDCSFERRLELRGGRVGAFAGRRHGARVVRGLSETGHGGIEEFRP